MRKRLQAVAAAALAAAVVAAAPAGAQAYPPPVRSISVDDPTPAPGQAITVTLRTCTPRTVALIGIDLWLVAAPVVGPDGVARATVTVPPSLRPGRHAVSGLCVADGRLLFLTTTITVERAAGPPPGAPSGGPGATAPGGGPGGGPPVPPAGGAGAAPVPGPGSGTLTSGTGGGGAAVSPLVALAGGAPPADAPALFEEAARAHGVTGDGAAAGGEEAAGAGEAAAGGPDGPAAHDGGRAWWSTLVRVVPGMAGLGGVPVALAVGHRPRRRPARPARPVRVPA